MGLGPSRDTELQADQCLSTSVFFTLNEIFWMVYPALPGHPLLSDVSCFRLRLLPVPPGSQTAFPPLGVPPPHRALPKDRAPAGLQGFPESRGPSPTFPPFNGPAWNMAGARYSFQGSFELTGVGT